MNPRGVSPRDGVPTLGGLRGRLFLRRSCVAVPSCDPPPFSNPFARTAQQTQIDLYRFLTRVGDCGTFAQQLPSETKTVRKYHAETKNIQGGSGGMVDGCWPLVADDEPPHALKTSTTRNAKHSSRILIPPRGEKARTVRRSIALPSGKNSLGLPATR